MEKCEKIDYAELDGEGAEAGAGKARSAIIVTKDCGGGILGYIDMQ